MPEESAPAVAAEASAGAAGRIYPSEHLDMRAGQAINRDDGLALQSLIDQGLNPNAWISSRSAKVNMLCTSVSGGRAQCLEVLLKAGADLCEANRVSTTEWASLLELAVMRKDCSVMRVLLNNGHDVNVQTNKKRNNLANLAACQGWIEQLVVLDEYGVDLHHRNDDGETALHQSILSSMAPVTCQWASARAPSLLNTQDKLGNTPLMVALRWHKDEAAMVLLDHDQDLAIVDLEQRSALAWARLEGRDEVASRIEAIQNAKRAHAVIAEIARAGRSTPSP